MGCEHGRYHEQCFERSVLPRIVNRQCLDCLLKWLVYSQEFEPPVYAPKEIFNVETAQPSE